MKILNLRDANQQFSKLVREIEETGESVLVLRNGKPAVRLVPAEEKAFPRKLTPAQKAALADLRDPRNHFRSPEGWKFNREELHDEIESRHAVVRTLDGSPKKKL